MYVRHLQELARWKALKSSVVKSSRILALVLVGRNDNINDELRAATQPYANEPGCPICILDPEGNPLQMNVTGGVHVPCPDGYQKKGFSCSKLSTCDISLIRTYSFFSF